MTSKELIRCLRACTEDGSCRDCPLYNDLLCESTLKLEAADMLEAATEPGTMRANEYQKLAMRTAAELTLPSDRLMNGLMGLCGESGECMDVLKKYYFQGHELDREKLAEELGDVAWYLALSADALGLTLEEVLKRNIEKLRARYPEGFDPERSVNRAES